MQKNKGVRMKFLNKWWCTLKTETKITLILILIMGVYYFFYRSKF